MRIHNFYTDLLLSLRYLFDDLIFGTGVIKSYEFNVGNKTFQLKYESQFPLPASILNFQSTKAFAYRPITYQRYPGKHSSKIPVLYNKTKNLELMLQEELFEIMVEVLVNCESGLQAMEMSIKLENFAPLNKYFQFYKFKTFLEIDEEYLFSNKFDVNNDDIINLFLKHNRRTNKVDYCFSVQYEPLIRFDAVTAQIASSDQRSFPISCSLAILNPVPIYLEILRDQRPFNPITKYYTRNNIILNTGIVDILLLNRQEMPVYISDITDGEFTSLFNYNSIDYTIIGIIDKEEIRASGNIVVQGRDISVEIVIINNLVENILESVNLYGDLSGRLNHPLVTETTVSGGLNTIFNNKLLSLNVSIDNYKIISRTKNLLSYRIIPALPIYIIKLLSVNNFYNTNLDLNKNLISVQSILISKYIIRRDGLYNSEYYEIEESTIVDGSGNFISSFNIDDVLISISGRLNKKSGSITYSLSYDDELSSYELISMYLTIEATSNNNYGQRQIEKVDFFTENELSSITSSLIPIIENRRLLKHIIITEDNILREEDNIVISVIFDEAFNYDNIYSQYNLYWRFIFGSVICSSEDKDTNFIIKTRDENSYPAIVEFEVNKDFFYRYLDDVSSTNPIIFQLYRLD